MNVLPVALREAASEASARLVTAARDVARPGGDPGRGMAASAEAAVFSDALLGAMRSRFEALKAVTK